MKLCVTSWSFPHLSLDEAGAVVAALGLDGLDVGYFYGATLDRARVLASPEAYGAEIAARLPVAVANLYHLFGADPAERNLAGPADPRNREDARAALAFAAAAGAPTVFVLPGLVNPGQDRGAALAASAEALKPMVEDAARAGVTLTVEPHVHSYLETPALAGELVERVPGLKLTLDPAHYVCLGYRQAEIEALCPHVGHVHLRQARPGVLQAKLEEGTINFPAFLGALAAAGYDGWLAIEYVHQNYMATVYDDVLSETVKMRDAVRGWLAAR